VKIQIELIRARLRAPFAASTGSIDSRELLLLRLEGDDGVAGYGEAAPLESYDGVAIGVCRAALEDCREILAQSDGEDREGMLAECARVAVLPQAVAAVDLALWDLAGRRARQPVWRLLGAAAADPVEVNYTIAAEDRAGAASEAASARAAGFRCVKVKVGIGDDAGRVAAVRAAAGPEMSIRLDANGAWSVPEAEATLRALEPVGIELCEEPVRGLPGVAELSAELVRGPSGAAERSTPVPIAIDETAAAPGALDARVCDSVCLKIARCGGISGVLDAARRARSAGYGVYLASTLDGPLGIAAALHAAAAVAPDRPCGLATLGLFEGREDPLPVSRGQMAVPHGAGLGEGLVDWYPHIAPIS
jgi:L-alanine-DL-glutamate epimerase-like enolase superfamily enzyme